MSLTKGLSSSSFLSSLLLFCFGFLGLVFKKGSSSSSFFIELYSTSLKFITSFLSSYYSLFFITFFCTSFLFYFLFLFLFYFFLIFNNYFFHSSTVYSVIPSDFLSFILILSSLLLTITFFIFFLF